MRQKQRPIKSSGNQSVTSLNDSTQNSSEYNTAKYLAYLANNDIPPEVWKGEIDFDSLIKATLLKRNFQQHLKQKLNHNQQDQQQQQLDKPQEQKQQKVEQKEDDGYSELPGTSHDQEQIEPIEAQSGGFLCDQPDCGKTFITLRKLIRHKVVHSDEFPFVCQFEGCGKKFKRKFGIDLHSTTHFDLTLEMFSKTPIEGGLPFFNRRMQYNMCEQCNLQFKNVYEYQFHMAKHSENAIKCPFKGCNQSFSIWKSFQKHRLSHYFTYHCKLDPQCDHSTSNIQLLKMHIYCCHLQRKLPANSKPSKKDLTIEASSEDES